MPGGFFMFISNCLRRLRQETGHEFVFEKEPKLRPTLPTFILRIMTLKNAALLALIGTILKTALLLWTFVFTFLNVLRGLVPAAMLFSPFIYAFGCFTVAVFFYVFHRAQ